VNARHAGRLPAIAENPVLSAFDQLEIASGDPLSRGTPPPRRANLTSRASELVPEVIAALQSDEHPDVKRALASTTERTAG
jgi:hypothetical protein